MISSHGTNPIFFNKKIKIERPEHSDNPPTPLRPITSRFGSPPPPQSGHICVSTLN